MTTIRQHRTAAHPDPATCDAISARMRAHIAAGYRQHGQPVSLTHPTRQQWTPGTMPPADMFDDELTAELGRIDPVVETVKRDLPLMAPADYSALRQRRIDIEGELWARANPAKAAQSRAAVHQQAQMQQHDRRDPSTLPARDQLTPAELATAGIDPARELTPEVAANLRTLAAAATRPTSPLCALLTYTETATKLAVSVRWVRQLARTGKLTTTAGHITAPSVVAYAAQRHNTRWTKAAVPTDAQRIRHAHDAMKRAAKLECEARKLRDGAKATLIGYGPGLHDGWLISQTEPVNVAAHIRKGSWRATPAAT